MGKEKLAGAELSSGDVDKLGHAAASCVRFVVVLVVDGVHRQILDSSIAVSDVAEGTGRVTGIALVANGDGQVQA